MLITQLFALTITFSLALLIFLTLKLSLNTKPISKKLLFQNVKMQNISLKQLYFNLLLRYTFAEFFVIRKARFKLNQFLTLSLFCLFATLFQSSYIWGWSAGLFSGFSFLCSEIYIHNLQEQELKQNQISQKSRWVKLLVYGTFAVISILIFFSVAQMLHYLIHLNFINFGYSILFNFGIDQIISRPLILLIFSSLLKQWKPLLQLKLKYQQLMMQQPKSSDMKIINNQATSPRMNKKRNQSPSKIPMSNKKQSDYFMIDVRAVQDQFNTPNLLQLDSSNNILQLTGKRRSKRNLVNRSGFNSPKNKKVNQNVSQQYSIDLIQQNISDNIEKYETPIRLVRKRQSRLLMSDLQKILDQNTDEFNKQNLQVQCREALDRFSRKFRDLQQDQHQIQQRQKNRKNEILQQDMKQLNVIRNNRRELKKPYQKQQQKRQYSLQQQQQNQSNNALFEQLKQIQMKTKSLVRNNKSNLLLSSNTNFDQSSYIIKELPTSIQKKQSINYYFQPNSNINNHALSQLETNLINSKDKNLKRNNSSIVSSQIQNINNIKQFSQNQNQSQSKYDSLNTVQLRTKQSRRKNRRLENNQNKEKDENNNDTHQVQYKRKLKVRSSRKSIINQIQEQTQQEDNPNFEIKQVPAESQEDESFEKNQEIQEKVNITNEDYIRFNTLKIQGQGQFSKHFALHINNNEPENNGDLQQVDLNSPLKKKETNSPEKNKSPQKNISPQKNRDIKQNNKTIINPKSAVVFRPLHKRDIKDLRKFNHDSPYLQYLPDMLNKQIENKKMHSIIDKQHRTRNHRKSNFQKSRQMGISDYNNQNACPQLNLQDF